MVLPSLLALDLPEVEQSYTVKDTTLYALGCDAGLGPADERQLSFVCKRDIHALPTMVSVLALPGFCIRDLYTGIASFQITVVERGIVALHNGLATLGPVRDAVLAKLNVESAI